MLSNLTVFYLTDISFPDGGMAAGNRILHLAKALSNGGAVVHVLTALSDSRKKEDMDIEGVHYHSLSNRTSWFGRNLTRYLLFYLSAFVFICRHRTKDIALYCYGINAFGTILAYLMSLFLRCPLCREGAEFPYALISKSSAWNVVWQVGVLRLFDGVIAITENLRDYYQKHTRRTCCVLYVPMTVDWNLFAHENRSNPFDFEYIAYTGNMYRKGGGVDVLVKAFNLVAEDFPDLHLVLMGNGSDQLQKKFEEMLKPEYKSRLTCLFSAHVPRTDMPRYIKNAKLLAMLPLSTKQQEGCFPTKLGEYMATGVPTVISRVGNPAECLSGEENIIYVTENSPEETAETIKKILLNYNWALDIARKGQAFAKDHFDYARHTDVLDSWYSDLLKK